MADSVQKKQKNKKVSFKSGYGCKQTGRGFIEQRKNRAISKYEKILKSEKRESTITSRNKTPAKNDRFEQIRQKAEEKKRKKEEEIKQKNELRAEKEAQRQKAIAESKQKRKTRQKLLSKRNHRGQVFLNNQIGFLLEKIQKNQGQSSGSKT